MGKCFEITKPRLSQLILTTKEAFSFGLVRNAMVGSVVKVTQNITGSCLSFLSFTVMLNEIDVRLKKKSCTCRIPDRHVEIIGI